MSAITDFLDKKWYADFNKNWDDKIFRQEILNKISPEYSILDFGAGRGNVDQMNFLDHCSLVAGVDLSESVHDNPYLNEAKILVGHTIPYPDDFFNLVFADNVMEHVQHPDTVLEEIYRVMKPGGFFLFKTPNKWHYVAIFARLTPHWFHKFYNKLRGRKEIDTFPTTYKLNCSKAINIHAKKNGFIVKKIQIIEARPEYLRLSAFTYLFGLLYERIVNLSDIFKWLRCVIICELEKPNC